GGSFRPTYALVATLPVVWSVGLSSRLLVIGLVAGVGTLAWLGPTVYLSGGWHAYKVASDALIGSFAEIISPRSSSSDPRDVGVTSRDPLVGALSAVGRGLLALLVRRGLGGPFDVLERGCAPLGAMIAVPATLFFGLFFCAEPGYLAPLIP